MSAIGYCLATPMKYCFKFVPHHLVLLAGLVVSGSLVQTAWTAGFTNVASLKTARRLHTDTALPDGRVLVVGGLGRDTTNYAEIYDPASNEWTPFPGPQKYGHSASLLSDGTVLIAGGAGYATDVEIFDPTSGNRTNAARLQIGRDRHTATLLPNGRLLVAGGSENPGLSTAELYFPSSGVWTNTGSMLTKRKGHTATLLGNGKVMVTGGQATSESSLTSVEIYDPATGLWTNTHPLRVARVGHTATLLPNGFVLIVGGSSPVFPTRHVEVCDPDGQDCTLVAPLQAARGGHTATLLRNGKVLVAGGNGFGVLTSAELYDSVSNTWTPAGEMANRRFLHTATVLLNGDILMAAGSDNASSSIATAELYKYSSVNGDSIRLIQPAKLVDGTFRFTFGFTPESAFRLFATTNLSLPPDNWTELGGIIETSPGEYRFEDFEATNYPLRFYRVRLP